MQWKGSYNEHHDKIPYPGYHYTQDRLSKSEYQEEVTYITSWEFIHPLTLHVQAKDASFSVCLSTIKEENYQIKLNY
jgi:hypothetical protein